MNYSKRGLIDVNAGGQGYSGVHNPSGRDPKSPVWRESPLLNQAWMNGSGLVTAARGGRREQSKIEPFIRLCVVGLVFIVDELHQILVPICCKHII